jgi:hypothetical protein
VNGAMRATIVALGVYGSALLAACAGTQDLANDCPDADGACPPCSAHEECVVVSNPCHDTAWCTHVDRDPPLAVNQIGCNLEHEVPPDSACGCVRGACAAR